MAEPLPDEVLDSAVQPTQVAQQSFELERRGYDQAQVRSFLIAVSESLRDAQSREAEMRTRLGRAIRRAEEADAAMREGVASDPGELTRQLGDEVATVLDAARAAGEQRIAAAEKSAEQLLTNAKTEANALRQAAETIMDERRAEADAAAAQILNDCEVEADQIREKARADSDVMRKDAADDVVRARNECESLIREAEAVRVQILEDMERRRRQSRAQVERLRVGRDRLLRSYDIVRRTLDESTGELKSSLREAKVLGDTAARKVAAEPLASPAELEDELAAKRMLSSRSKTGPAAEVPAPAPQAELPEVDLRSGHGHSSASVRPFTEVVAPTPRRPAELPKPPAVAPTIKVESATTAIEVAPASESDEAAGAANTADYVELSADADADVDVDVEPGDIIEVKDAEVEEEELDLTGLPEGELDVVEPNDEVEQVVALKAVVDTGATSAPTSPALVEQIAPEAPAAAREPEVVEPEAAVEVEVAELEAVEVEVAEPEAAEPIVAEPIVAEPEAAEPVVAEPVVAEPIVAESEPDEASSGLFDALREQKKPAAKKPTAKPAPKPKAKAKTAAKRKKKPAAKKSQAKKPAAKKTQAKSQAKTDPKRAAALAKQRDAVIAEVSIDIAKRLKRGLADEQNDMLAGIRSAGKPRRGRKPTSLISMVGETDDHLDRYVAAIAEVAASSYRAGAALIDGRAPVGEMPAGAVEELLATQVVVPQRLHLIELDKIEVEESADHLDAIRSFYRSRKNSSLESVAQSLGALLVTAGACDALPPGTALPWLS